MYSVQSIVQQKGVRKPASPDLNRGQLFYAAAAAQKCEKCPKWEDSSQRFLTINFKAGYNSKLLDFSQVPQVGEYASDLMIYWLSTDFVMISADIYWKIFRANRTPPPIARFFFKNSNT